MKKLFILIILSVILLINISKADQTVKKDPTCCQAIGGHITEVNHQLRSIEKEIKDNKEIQSIKYDQLHRQVTHMEKKFDNYFLWGYGTLISLILAILASGWVAKKKMNTS